MDYYITTSRVQTLRWLRLTADRFGILEGEIQLDPVRLTLLIGRNETGKSTFIAALIAALYGVDTSLRRNDPRPYIEDFHPWSGNEYKVELALEMNGRHLEIVRDFAKNTFNVNDFALGDITKQYGGSRHRDRFGEVLTGGLSAGGFLRSFIIAQEQASLLAQPEELVEKIQAIVTASPGDSTTRVAQDLLEKALDRVQAESYFKTPVKAGSAQKKLEEEILRIKQEISELKAKLVESSADLAELSAKEERKQQLLLELEQVRKGALLAEKKEIEQKIGDIQNAAQRIERLQEEEKTLEEAKHFPLDLVMRFNGTLERYRERLEAALNADQEKRNRFEALQVERKRLDTYKDLDSLDIPQVDEFTNDLRLWVKLHKNCERYAEEQDLQRELLAKEGIYANRLEYVINTVSGWKEGTIEHFENMNRERKVLEDVYKAADEKVATHRLPKKKIRVTFLGTMIIAITLIAAFLAAIEWKVEDNAGIALIVTLTAVFLVIVIGLIEHLRYKREEKRFRRDLEKAAKALHKIEIQLKDLATSVGLESPDLLQDIIKDYYRLSGKGSQYFKSSAVSEQGKEELRQVSDRIAPYLEKAGVISAGGQITRGDVEGFIARLDRYHTDLQTILDLENRYESACSDSRRAEDRVQELWNELRTLFDAASIPFGEDLELAVADFNHTAERAKRLREIGDQVQSLQKNQSKAVIVTKYRSRLHDIVRQLEGLTQIEAQEDELAEHRRQEELISSELRLIDREINDERVRLANETARLPKLLRDAEHTLILTKQKLEGLNIQVEAANLALQTITEVEKEVFGNAARILNEKLAPILISFIPRWKSAIFDDQLRLHLQDEITAKQLEPEDIERVLSAGARDALYLGARMALGDFLAGGIVNAPYVLDEPFAHLDDERFFNGMKLLMNQVIAGNQVILLTCHKARHAQWLQSLDKVEQQRVAWQELGRGEGGEG